MCHYKDTEYLKFGEMFLLQLVLPLNKPSQISSVNNNHYFIMLTASGVQEFQQGTVGMACLWYMMCGSSASLG